MELDAEKEAHHQAPVWANYIRMKTGGNSNVTLGVSVIVSVNAEEVVLCF